ncbi:hypothetical protein PybrP1_003251 [[Pythium] brassicae (nom. inval.)]|nr:hypothetical protein PybrP1_003251 [[Pythium] brassicae (nom. inval.)]
MTGDSSHHSSSDASAGHATSRQPARTKRKPRKATHTLRKEEKSELVGEIERLQTQLDKLQRRALGLDDGKTDEQRCGAVAALRDALQQQLARFTDAQALFSSLGTSQVISPIGVPIRLGRDRRERLATLAAVRDKKMRVAQSFLARRCGPEGLSSRTPRTEEQRFETPGGDFFAVHFSASQFRGARSVRQVFDILHFYNRNIEISASEKLGNITIREDDDVHEESVFQNRLVGITGDARLLIESNTILFADCVDSAGGTGEGRAVLAAEFVDADELYPYRPDQRVRMDHSTVITLTSYMQRAPSERGGSPDENSSEELVVVLTRWSHSRLHRPEFPVSHLAMHELREGMSKWFEAMHRTLYEALDPDGAT